MKKYCFNCGVELPQQAKFCTNCGQKQLIETSVQPDESVELTPETITSQSVEKVVVPEQTPIEQPEAQSTNQIQQTLGKGSTTNSTTDTLLGLVAKGGMDVGPLMRENAIIERKIELGYSSKSDNFVYVATPIDWSDLITIGGLTGMKSQNYVLSFEEDGLLLMGCIGMMKFNDDNHFIKNSDVTKMDLEKYPITSEWDHMYLEIDNQQLELLVQRPTFSVIKWHRRNFNNVLAYTM